jgi:hypothetical protein
VSDFDYQYKQLVMVDIHYNAVITNSEPITWIADQPLHKIKLYIDDDLEEMEDCDGDEDCTVYIRVRESQAGYHTLKAKVYDEDGDTETDTIRVYVRPYDYYGYPYDYPYDPYPYDPYPSDRPQISASSSPSTILTSDSFRISASASDRNGIDRIELWHGGAVIGRYGCPGSYSCSRTFTVSPKYTAGTYPFEVRAYDRLGYSSNMRLNVAIQSRLVCGDGTCNSGETCSTCSQDCGPCNYCGDGRCTSTETCSSCQQDCGQCAQPTPAPVTPIVYTCEQRGGQCCEYGGTGAVSGAADCAATCFTECNAPPEPEPEPTDNGGPTGAVVVSDASLALFGLLTVILLVLIYIAAKVR